MKHRAAFLLVLVAGVLLCPLDLQAQTDPPADVTEGVGTYFEAQGPDGIVTLTTSESVDVMLAALPGRRIDLALFGNEGVTSCDFTITGLHPDRTYYVYEKLLVDPVEIVTGPDGSVTFTRDASGAVYLWIQPTHSTLVLGENGLVHDDGTPFAGATWDALTRTATLTQDVSEAIRLLAPNATLDGACHSVVTEDPIAVRLDGENVTVENLRIRGLHEAIGVHNISTIRSVHVDMDTTQTTIVPQGVVVRRAFSVSGPRILVDSEVTASGPYRVIGAPGCGGRGAPTSCGLCCMTVYNNNFYATGQWGTGGRPEDTSSWFDPVLGGNYYANYPNTDTDGDGFGDVAIVIGPSRVDELPLMSPVPTPCAAAESSVSLAGTVSSDCDGSLEGVGVSLTLASGDLLSTSTTAAGAYGFEVPASSGPGTVAVDVPGGYETTNASAAVALSADATVDFALSCVYVDVSGAVASDCAGAALVTVDLAYGDSFLTTSTDVAGGYLFEDIRWTEEAAEVSIVVPLGMTSASPTDGHAAIALTDDVTLDFALECLAVTGEVRSMGYWKHQARVYLHDRGSAQETEVDMVTTYPSLLFSHFHDNELNAIAVEGVSYMATEAGDAPVDLARIAESLTVNGGASMLDRAKQQYLALLLNVASGKQQTWAVISEDGLTVSQALQDVADRINNGDPGDDELAKDVSEWLNLGQTVPAGYIRDLWETIAYRESMPSVAPVFSVQANRPNPFNPRTTIAFTLPEARPYVLSVYDAIGRLVDERRGDGQPGRNAIVWDATGRRLASGMYFYRLRSGELEQSRKMMLLE